jgi:hypothetical protein
MFTFRLEAEILSSGKTNDLKRRFIKVIQLDAGDWVGQLGTAKVKIGQGFAARAEDVPYKVRPMVCYVKTDFGGTEGDRVVITGKMILTDRPFVKRNSDRIQYFDDFKMVVEDVELLKPVGKASK